MKVVGRAEGKDARGRALRVRSVRGGLAPSD